MLSEVSFIRTDHSEIISGRVDPIKKRLLVEIKDEVISTQVPKLRRGLIEIIEKADPTDWKALYLDMRATRLIDSMGVNWLYAETVRISELRKSMVLRISSPAINRVIHFAGLDKMVTLKFRRRKQTR
jgi:anti-anti-sigma factor